MENKEQLAFSLSFPPTLKREDFFITDSNNDAFSWIDAWPNWGSYGLILIGPKRAGKTHLAKIWSQKANAHELTKSERNNRNNLEKPCKNNWLIENIDQLFEQKQPNLFEKNLKIPNTDQEINLFHWLNHIKNSGHFLLITSESPMNELQIELPDLTSRLRALPTAIIENPDERLLANLALKLFTDRGIWVETDLISYILPRIERSVQSLEQTINKLDQASLKLGKKLTKPLTKDIMGW